MRSTQLYSTAAVPLGSIFLTTMAVNQVPSHFPSQIPDHRAKSLGTALSGGITALVGSAGLAD